MIGMRHMRRGSRGAVVLTALAVTMFVLAPFLLAHHHHSDISEDTRCAVCVFASAHVAPAPTVCVIAPSEMSFPLADAAVVRQVASAHSLPWSGRAPPQV